LKISLIKFHAYALGSGVFLKTSPSKLLVEDPLSLSLDSRQNTSGMTVFCLAYIGTLNFVHTHTYIGIIAELLFRKRKLICLKKMNIL